MNRENESPNDQRSRHEEHQQMLELHKQRKAIARERHRKQWHKFRVIPIILV